MAHAQTLSGAGYHPGWNEALFKIPRTRGLVSGFIVMLLGIWVGLVPFIGPMFGYTIGSGAAWDFTMTRFWFSILPGAAAFLAGVILMASANRAVLGMAGWLGLLAGLWLIVGLPLSALWNPTTLSAAGGPTQQALEQIGYFFGSGAVITALSGMAIGRLSMRSVRDLKAAGDDIDDNEH